MPILATDAPVFVPGERKTQDQSKGTNELKNAEGPPMATSSRLDEIENTIAYFKARPPGTQPPREELVRQITRFNHDVKLYEEITGKRVFATLGSKNEDGTFDPLGVTLHVDGEQKYAHKFKALTYEKPSKENPQGQIMLHFVSNYFGP
jgi:hypothetical protein